MLPDAGGLSTLNNRFPCREPQIRILSTLIGVRVLVFQAARRSRTDPRAAIISVAFEHSGSWTGSNRQEFDSESSS